MGNPDGGLDQGEKSLGIAHEVICLTSGDSAGDASLGSGPLASTGREKGCPLGQLRSNRGEQCPCVAGTAVSSVAG